MQMSPINAVLGLGNPGPDYEGTRHNVGFSVVDRVLERVRVVETLHRFDSQISIARFGGRSIWFAKPQTFMNLSGKAAVGIVNHLGMSCSQILVVYDCMDLPLGRFRLRKNGSSGGQKGMESVLQTLETRNVPRLRVGIGRDTEAGVVDHVLSRWSAAEQTILNEVLDAAADAVMLALKVGIEKAMNEYNGWMPESERIAREKLDPKGQQNQEPRTTNQEPSC
jgi:PTH1 family peptidyl-tRNA hydrolase